VKGGKDPRTLAKTSSLQKKTDAEEKVDQRIGQELERKGGSNHLPRDGSSNGKGKKNRELYFKINLRLSAALPPLSTDCSTHHGGTC
jgi:hypothetical protein